MNRSPIRSSLHRVAHVAQDAQPLDDAERREMFRRAWQQQGVAAFDEANVPAMFWAAIVAMAERVYGKRRS